MNHVSFFSEGVRIILNLKTQAGHSLIQYACLSYQRILAWQSFSPYLHVPFKIVFLKSVNFSVFMLLLQAFVKLLSSCFCVGGFQRAATKAGSVPCSCTKSMPEKMPTPTCCQRKRPATCIKFSVGTSSFTYSQVKVNFLKAEGKMQVNVMLLYYEIMKWDMVWLSSCYHL